MLVQRVVSPVSPLESWTVLGADDVPVAPIERYLAYLSDIERSPNTIKAYAHDLKDWFVFLAGRGLDWGEVRLEDVGEFVAWQRDDVHLPRHVLRRCRRCRCTGWGASCAGRSVFGPTRSCLRTSGVRG